MNLFKVGKKVTFLQISIVPSFKEANQVRLVHTINIQSSEQTFLKKWKRAKICPIPKMIEPECPANYYRLILVYLIISKVSERVVLFQMTHFIENKYSHHQYHLDNFCHYSKSEPA